MLIVTVGACLVLVFVFLQICVECERVLREVIIVCLLSSHHSCSHTAHQLGSDRVDSRVVHQHVVFDLGDSYNQIREGKIREDKIREDKR